jgi:hypothetical protein
VALPLEKLGTTHPLRTTPIDAARSRVPWVVKNCLAAVV